MPGHSESQKGDTQQIYVYVFFRVLYRLVQLQIRPRNVLLHEVLTDMRPDVGVTTRVFGLVVWFVQKVLEY